VAAHQVTHAITAPDSKSNSCFLRARHRGFSLALCRALFFRARGHLPQGATAAVDWRRTACRNPARLDGDRVDTHLRDQAPLDCAPTPVRQLQSPLHAEPSDQVWPLRGRPRSEKRSDRRTLMSSILPTSVCFAKPLRIPVPTHPIPDGLRPNTG